MSCVTGPGQGGHPLAGGHGPGPRGRGARLARGPRRRPRPRPLLALPHPLDGEGGRLGAQRPSHRYKLDCNVI